MTPATQDQFNELDAKVGQSMIQAGGLPAGLMSHGYPEGEGFVIAEVWRAEPEGQGYIDDVLRPLIAESGLTGQDTVVRPVWSFARARHTSCRDRSLTGSPDTGGVVIMPLLRRQCEGQFVACRVRSRPG